MASGALMLSGATVVDFVAVKPIFRHFDEKDKQRYLNSI